VDTSKNIQPNRKKNPIAAVRYVICGKSNKITRIILTTSRMPQIVNEMIDIVSVAFLDIGYSGAFLHRWIILWNSANMVNRFLH
jgi:hypothetical protein